MRARGVPEETQGRLEPQDLMGRWELLEIEVSLVLMDSLDKRGHRGSAASRVLLGLRAWMETQDAMESQV